MANKLTIKERKVYLPEQLLAYEGLSSMKKEIRIRKGFVGPTTNYLNQQYILGAFSFRS